MNMYKDVSFTDHCCLVRQSIKASYVVSRGWVRLSSRVDSSYTGNEMSWERRP